MSTFAVAERLSAHIGITAGGAMVCAASVIARSGMYQYKREELGLPGSGLVNVWRDPSEVFDKQSMATGEGVPCCLFHPSKFVSPENWASIAKGHAQNIRPGLVALDDGNWPLLADLVLNDVRLIDEVKNGVRQISCGYDCEYFERSDGTYEQRKIVINHIAILPKGRATNARIVDGESMNLEDLEQRFDRLLDLMKGIIKPDSAKPASPRTETTDEKGRVLSFGESMDVLAEQDRERSFQYGEACNAVGRAMRERRALEDCRPSLRRRATDAEETDPFAWADRLNARGRELRERR